MKMKMKKQKDKKPTKEKYTTFENDMLICGIAAALLIGMLVGTGTTVATNNYQIGVKTVENFCIDRGFTNGYVSDYGDHVTCYQETARTNLYMKEPIASLEEWLKK